MMGFLGYLEYLEFRNQDVRGYIINTQTSVDIDTANNKLNKLQKSFIFLI